MVYLSKGLLLNDTDKNRLLVVSGSKVFSLKDTYAAVWLDGFGKYCVTEEKSNCRVVEKLKYYGLCNMADNDSDCIRLSLLCSCIPFIPNISTGTQNENNIMYWISTESFTVAEIIRLLQCNADKNIYKQPDGFQDLIDMIYDNDASPDNMESIIAKIRNNAYDNHIRNILDLVSSRKIYLC